MLWSGIAGVYGNSIFSFLRETPHCSHGGSTNLHPQQQCMRIPFSILSPAFIICRVFGDDHFDQCEVIPPL